MYNTTLSYCCHTRLRAPPGDGWSVLEQDTEPLIAPHAFTVSVWTYVNPSISGHIACDNSVSVNVVKLFDKIS